MAGPSYNYAQVSYVNADLDNGPTLDGIGLAGSFALTRNFHIAVDHLRVSDSPFRVETTTIAGGFNTPLNDATDFVARLGFVNARARVTGFGSASDDGWMAQAGLRSMVTETFEFNAFLTHTDVGGSDTAVGIGAVFHMTYQLALAGGVEFSDGDVLTHVGLRWSF